MMKVEDKIKLSDLIVELLNSKETIEAMLQREKDKVESVKMHDGFVLSESGIHLEDGVSKLSKINTEFNSLITAIEDLSDEINL